ncbi:MAG: aminotransferase class IV [Verrucomicrobiota bacterium]
MSDWMILNGQLVEGGEVALGVKDPGLAYGFGVFETIRFRKGKACFLREHSERLMRAMREAGISGTLSLEDLEVWARRLFEANEVEEGIFKVIASSVCEGTKIAVFVRDVGLSSEVKPMRLRVSEICKSSLAFTSRHKTTNYIENLLELGKAKADGFDECLFRNEKEEITECCMSNFCFAVDGVLQVPSIDCGLLDGIARMKILEAAPTIGLEVNEGRFSIEDLGKASEAFVSNSGAGTVSIESIHSKEIEFRFPETKLADRLRKEIERLEEEAFA